LTIADLFRYSIKEEEKVLVKVSLAGTGLYCLPGVFSHLVLLWTGGPLSSHFYVKWCVHYFTDAEMG